MKIQSSLFGDIFRQHELTSWMDMEFINIKIVTNLITVKPLILGAPYSVIKLLISQM